VEEQVSDETCPELRAFDQAAAGIIEKVWGDATAAASGDVGELWSAAAELGWFELATAAALDLAVAAARRLGRAACPLPVLDGYAAAELFGEPRIATGEMRLVLTTDPQAPVDAGGAARPSGLPTSGVGRLRRRGAVR
jgi:hypothetical protein